MKLTMCFSDEKLAKEFCMKMYGHNIYGHYFDVHQESQLVKCIDFINKMKVPYAVCHAYLGNEKYYEKHNVKSKKRIDSDEADRLPLKVIVF